MHIIVTYNTVTSLMKHWSFHFQIWSWNVFDFFGNGISSKDFFFSRNSILRLFVYFIIENKMTVTCNKNKVNVN